MCWEFEPKLGLHNLLFMIASLATRCSIVASTKWLLYWTRKCCGIDVLDAGERRRSADLSLTYSILALMKTSTLAYTYIKQRIVVC